MCSSWHPSDVALGPISFYTPLPTPWGCRSSQVTQLRQHCGCHWQVFSSPRAWLKSRPETDSSSPCSWFNLNPQGPEAHRLNSVSFSSEQEPLVQATSLSVWEPEIRLHAPGWLNTFSWLEDKFQKFCPTMAWGGVFAFIFATCESKDHRLLGKKISKMPIKEVAN